MFIGLATSWNIAPGMTNPRETPPPKSTGKAGARLLAGAWESSRCSLLDGQRSAGHHAEVLDVVEPVSALYPYDPAVHCLYVELSMLALWPGLAIQPQDAPAGCSGLATQRPLKLADPAT